MLIGIAVALAEFAIIISATEQLMTMYIPKHQIWTEPLIIAVLLMAILLWLFLALLSLYYLFGRRYPHPPTGSVGHGK